MGPTNRQRFRNVIHSVLLLGGMAGITWICVAVSVGPAEALWTLLIVGVVLGLLPRAPKSLLLSLYRARPLGHRDFPEGVDMVRRLAQQADLPRVPLLYYLPSSVPNAFAVGSPGDSAIAVSDGLLRTLDGREFFNVLAHEVSHIAHRDLWLMALADMLARLTGLAALVGIFMLGLNLPLFLLGREAFPWIAVIILIFAPTIMALLQLSLSRAREYDADLGAVNLTGDPRGLASALARLESKAGRFWEGILMPGRRAPDPSLLRSHPSTKERIRRLAELLPESGREQPDYDRETVVRHIPTVTSAPRWHRTGAWF